MIAQVFKITGSVTRSIRSAVLIDEVEIHSIPANQHGFAVEYGGDFIELLEETAEGEELCLSTSE